MFSWSLVRTIIILPGTALVFVPAGLLWLYPGFYLSPDALTWMAVVPAAAGLFLASWTVRLLVTVGEGTPAPWEPPKKLVVRGPYRYLRNPMIGSVLFMLLAEALAFHSWQISGWMVFVFAANSVYFPLFEEKGLEARFGDDYRLYKANVPRWIPRLTAWKPPEEN